MLLAFSLLLTSCGVSAAVKKVVAGDINGDEKVTAADLTVLLQKIQSKASPDENTDLNLDSLLNEEDAKLLQDYLAGIHSVFPKDCKHGRYSVEEISGKKYQICNDCGYKQIFQDMTGTKVAYIPIDNRPVDQERVIYLAQSVGIDLLMPEEDLYRTALDNMTKNKNGTTYGDRAKLLQWLKDVDKECDYFVISLDQVFSGGLVESRWASNTDLTFEYEVADEIIHLCENNTVVLFDTVMRLASTLDYHGYDYSKYETLRAYGKVSRKTLTGDKLTVENIINGYRFNANGVKIKTSLTEEEIEKYHASRTRKLKLIDYVLRNAGETMDSIYVGVDDSSPQTTIQTNEINYIKQLMGDRGLLSAGCDELGLCSLTRIITLLYGKAKANVVFFGPGKDKADEFDVEPLSSNIATHLNFMNTVSSTDDDALQILVLTSGSSATDRNKLLSTLQKNITDKKPSAIIDVSGSALDLGNLLFEKNEINVLHLLGYSSWNTAGNALGISLSLSISRYLYLNSVKESSAAANEGFLRSMTFAYVKDLSYIASNGRNPTGLLTSTKDCCVDHIVKDLNRSSMIVSLSSYKTASHKTISVTNLRLPWNRYFEATFDINFS